MKYVTIPLIQLKSFCIISESASCIQLKGFTPMLPVQQLLLLWAGFISVMTQLSWPALRGCTVSQMRAKILLCGQSSGAWAKMRISVNFNMSARPHIIYFPLVWMDVAKMIADAFQQSLTHIPANLFNTMSHVPGFFFCLFLEQLGESWIFIHIFQPYCLIMWHELVFSLHL